MAADIDPAARVLLDKLRIIPHHVVSLKRNKYAVIRRIAKELGWRIAKNDKDASMLWLDTWESSDLTNLRVGHFFGMKDLSTKCNLARTLNRMKTEFPQDYDFHPISFVLPNDKDRLTEYAAQYAALTASKPSKCSLNSVPTAAAASSGPAFLRNYRGSRGIKDRDPSSSDQVSASGGAGLDPPAHGCWPVLGVQAQPMPGAGDRLAFIIKPDMSSRGNGIYLSLSLDGIRELARAEEEAASAAAGPGAAAAASSVRHGAADSDDDDDDADAAEAKKLTLVQIYLPRPLLLDRRKFDLRIYVLVTGAFPTLRAYIYRQGLIRFATEVYEAPTEANVRHRKMFLTNYAVNKPEGAGGGMQDDVPDEEEDLLASPLAQGGAGAAAADDIGSVASDVADDEDAADSSGADEAVAGEEAAGDKRDPATKASGKAKVSAAVAAAALAAGGLGAAGWRGAPSRPRLRELVAAREGCKWSLDALLACLGEQGVDSAALWARIKDVIAKTLLAARPGMAQRYRAARPHLRREPPPPPPAARRSRSAPRAGGGGGGASAARAAARRSALEEAAVAAAAATASAAAAADAAAAAAAAQAAAAAAAAAAQSFLPGGRGWPGTTAASITAWGVAQASLGRRSLSASNGSGGGGGSSGPPPIAAAGRRAAPSGTAPATSGGNMLEGFGLVGTAVPLAVATPRGLAAAAGFASAATRGAPANASPGVNTFGLGVSGQGIGASPPVSGATAARGRKPPLGPVAVAAAAVPTGAAVSGAQMPLSINRAPVAARVIATPPDPAATAGGRGARVAAPPSGTPSAADTPTVASSTPSARQAAAAAAEAALEAEDGEQGFRCFELMGLDVILDMSHCTCARRDEFQHLVSRPDRAAWPAGAHRCQPRPVLLELNQSCSLHTDSDLDKVVKGDVVRDAFAMGAPDEAWLLTRFKEVLTLQAQGAVVAATPGSARDSAAEATILRSSDGKEEDGGGGGGGGSDADSGDEEAPARPAASGGAVESSATISSYDAAADAARLSRSRYNDIRNSVSLDDLPESQAAARESYATAVREAAALLELFPPAALAQVQRQAAHLRLLARKATAALALPEAQPVAAAAAGMTSSGLLSPRRPPLEATNLQQVPWVPAASPSIPAAAAAPACSGSGALALAEAWSEELWFGANACQRRPSVSTSVASDSTASDKPEAAAAPAAARKDALASSVSSAVAASAAAASSSSHLLSASAAASAYSLNCVPLLSERAQLVLLLRRIYEALHIGGYQRLLPPPSSQLVERYKAIAAYVPPALRETAAYARRRQEALATRAAFENKQRTTTRL